MATIDLNSDLGEGFGPWCMGDDPAMLGLVTSANVACGGHASDPETMFRTLEMARDNGVSVGAHPGFNDREGFGRRLIPMAPAEIGRMCAAQIGALQGLAAQVGTKVAYVKLHGALGNLAAADRAAADAIVAAVRLIDPALAILAISGTQIEQAARAAGAPTFSEIYADRAYLTTGELVPRDRPDSMLHDADEAAERLIQFLRTGLMPVVDGKPIALNGQSICVHGDGPNAVGMARRIRERLQTEGVTIEAFYRAKPI